MQHTLADGTWSPPSKAFVRYKSICRIVVVVDRQMYSGTFP